MAHGLKNITVITTRDDDDMTDLFSRTVIHYTSFILKMFFNPVLAMGGVSSNIINMAVFFKMGLKEGTTQSFLILSIADGLAALASLTNTICYALLSTVYIGAEGESRDVFIAYCITLMSVPYFLNFSTLITTVIAVVRCCCVVMPLRVKHVVTPGRQSMAILVFCSIIFSVQLYPTTSGRFIRYVDPQTNASRIHITGIKIIFLDAFRNTFCYFTLSVVMTCVLILAFALRQAARFQSSAASQVATSPTSLGSKRQTSSREIQVMKTVIFIAFVFVVSNIPTALVAVLRLNVDGFSRMGRYRHFYSCYLIITETFCLININANIFIFFFFNRLYRTCFGIFFKLQSRQSLEENTKG